MTDPEAPDRDPSAENRKQEFGDTVLEEVAPMVWELPQTDSMRVPARVLATDSLLDEIKDDRTFEQLQNVASLPGIASPALCMPDGHQGYGVPVGGVAATDAQSGCISPGAVGYDINCLAGETDVSLAFGRYRSLETLKTKFDRERAIVTDGEMRVSSPIQLFTESESRTVYELKTVDGDTVRATADHQFLTPDGMTELKELAPGETVFTSQFVGLPDEYPEEFIILDETDFTENEQRVASFLKTRGLLPLRSTDNAFARLLQLVGFHTGCGSFDGSQTLFEASSDEFERICQDIAEIGFTPSRVVERDQLHSEASDGDIQRYREAEAFAKVLSKLGAQAGQPTQEGDDPQDYYDRLANWQQAIYLASYFGASMQAPAVAESTENTQLTVTRKCNFEETTQSFLEHLADSLADIDIKASVSDLGSDGGHCQEQRLTIVSEPENLRRFLTTVGYRYNQHKQRQSALMIQSIKRQAQSCSGAWVPSSEAVVVTDGGTQPEEATPGDGFTVATTVASIESAGNERVYDIGVEHDAHNFLANQFVVSNCGVRMMRTNLQYDDIHGREEELVEALFDDIPTGLGGGGVTQESTATVETILDRGVEWAVEAGWATEADLKHCEDGGRRSDADPTAVSQRAKDRGRNQLGSLGSGNHFLEVQRVREIFDTATARAYNLKENQVVILIHCGSRGLGHQTCTDYLDRIKQTHSDLLTTLPDDNLAAAPAGSPVADEYYAAMCACINFAWVNRQLIMHQTRQVFADVFDRPWETMDMELLYDVAHNIAKKELHETPEGQRELYVHRKGATRAFPPGHPAVPAAYQDTGQPILIPGSMGAGSYVLSGSTDSLKKTFGSTPHGAGRLMSRTQAKREYHGSDVQHNLRQQNVYVKASSGETVAEEAPGVYKDIDEVVRVADELDIGNLVAQTFPICNIKG